RCLHLLVIIVGVAVGIKFIPCPGEAKASFVVPPGGVPVSHEPKYDWDIAKRFDRFGWVESRTLLPRLAAIGAYYFHHPISSGLAIDGLQGGLAEDSKSPITLKN